MDDRYPFIRFVIDAAQAIAGAAALVVLLGGTLRACGHGGFHGLMGFLVALGVAAVVYVVVMVRIEALRVFLDIESATRDLSAGTRGAETPAARADTGAAPSPPAS